MPFASLFALLIALWSARAGVSGLMEGLNIVYREVDARSLIVQYAISLALTALLLLVAIVALLVMVALPAALQIVDFGPLGAWLTALGPLLVLAVAVVFVIGALYRYGPHRATARKRWVSWGAVLATPQRDHHAATVVDFCTAVSKLRGSPPRRCRYGRNPFSPGRYSPDLLTLGDLVGCLGRIDFIRSFSRQPDRIPTNSLGREGV